METSPIPNKPENGVPISRARPVIELNLNVEEAMIEAVDLLRTIRIQLETITSTVNERLNQTFADAGDDVAKIVHNVETLSSNLAVSTGQLYQPVLFSVLFLLVALILFATLLCIICRIWRELRKGRNHQKSKTVKELEEAKMSKEEEVAELEKGKKQQSASKKRRTPLKWFRRSRESANGHRGSASRTPELREVYEKEPKGGSSDIGEYHQSSTLQHQEQREKQSLV